LSTIVLSGVLQVGAGHQVWLPVVQIPLPETCTLRWQLGIDCPGCGLTRGFVHMAHGRWEEAYAVHALSLPLFAFVLFQLPLAMAHWSAWEHPVVRSATRWNTVVLLALAGLMLCRWLWLLLFVVVT
jgi:hypothetical protein